MGACTGPRLGPSAPSERPLALYCWAASSFSRLSSARRRASRFAKPKRSSARRKNPRVVRLAQLSRSAFPRRRCASRVLSCCTSALPTAGSRAAAAMPSRSVDFPDPFSPTKKRDWPIERDLSQRADGWHRERKGCVAALARDRFQMHGGAHDCKIVERKVLQVAYTFGSQPRQYFRKRPVRWAPYAVRDLRRRPAGGKE